MASLTAGELIHRLVLEQLLSVADGAGGTITSFTPLATLWGHVESQGGREYYAARQLHPEITHQVTLRYRAGVVAGMRFRYGDSILRIVSSLDPSGSRERLLAMCTELVQ